MSLVQYPIVPFFGGDGTKIPDEYLSFFVESGFDFSTPSDVLEDDLYPPFYEGYLPLITEHLPPNFVEILCIGFHDLGNFVTDNTAPLQSMFGHRLVSNLYFTISSFYPNKRPFINDYYLALAKTTRKLILDKTRFSNFQIYIEKDTIQVAFDLLSVFDAEDVPEVFVGIQSSDGGKTFDSFVIRSSFPQDDE